MRIVVVGLGYVGLVTATCLARLGHTVVGLEADSRKLAALGTGRVPFFEPNLDADLATQLAAGRLTFTDRADEALRIADAILICVGTPSTSSGRADLGAVDSVVAQIADHLTRRTVVVLRSTVPVGTTRRLEAVLNEALARRGGPGPVPVVANPEFLRTGRAVDDFLRPSRVVLGRTALATDADIDLLVALYRPLEAPILVFDAESAELTKNAANAYLAMRISFVNELAALCEAAGASIDSVVRGLSLDPRIGGEYFRPGLGYGGSCLPKDVRSLVSMGAERGVSMELARAIDRVNEHQPARAAARLAGEFGGSLQDRRIGLLGLAFKPETDDVRDSPAIALARELAAAGASVAACDPKATERAREVAPWIEIVESPLEAARDADALVLATEWAVYVTADYAALRDVMRRPVLLDGRNALDGERLAALGFTYLRVGRPSPGRVGSSAGRPERDGPDGPLPEVTPARPRGADR